MAENETKKVSWFKKSGQGIVKLYKEVRVELKKVIWPNRTQLINNTATVLIFCFIIGCIIWVSDLGFGELSKIVFTR